MSGEIARRKDRQRGELKKAQRRTSDVSAPGHGGGTVAAWGQKVRGKRMMRLGTVAGPTGVFEDPRIHLASQLRRAMDPRRLLGTVTVYDAAGKPIATVNPLTRERTKTT